MASDPGRTAAESANQRLFVAAEFALVSIRDTRVEQMLADKVPGHSPEARGGWCSCSRPGCDAEKTVKVMRAVFPLPDVGLL